MKRENALIIGVIIVLFGVALISSASSGDLRQISKCTKTCSDEKRYSLNICSDNQKWELYNCNYEYKSCIFEAKINAIRNIIPKEKLNVCIKNQSNCVNLVKQEKKECVSNATNENTKCVKYCNSKDCRNESNPVCGYDGVTYKNDCFLRKAGFSKAYDGECIRYCYSDLDCRNGTEFCQQLEGSCMWNFGYLQTASAMCFNEQNSLAGCIPSIGSCIKIPEACIELDKPVCGCDGKTYSNECKMNAAKASKAYDGKCVEANCTILGQEISKEISSAENCTKDSDCAIGFIGAPCNFLMCGSAYNTNANLTNLWDLSDKYQKACKPICPLYMCRDPYSGTAKCNNNRCEIIYNI